MTRTARGKEIDMASLVAANDDMVTVGNTSTNVRGDIVSSTEVEVPAEVIEEAFQEKQDEIAKQPKTTVDDLHKKYRTPGKGGQVVFQERKFKRDGKNFVEIEYEDGSIEEKEVK
jgi:hypothetical protein|tara:strand:- start:1656 stop:2000 length:345 start_codon:yes stop_codon:yes gene_type:complete